MNPDVVTVTVKAYFDSLEKMDSTKWCELFAEDGIVYDPVGNPPIKVREKAEEFFGLLSKLFETMKVTLEQTFVVKNAAAVKWRMQVLGKNRRTGQVEGISTFELDETGKIRVVSSYWDDTALRVQLQG